MDIEDKDEANSNKREDNCVQAAITKFLPEAKPISLFGM
jgi:hypothetical protein